MSFGFLKTAFARRRPAVPPRPAEDLERWLATPAGEDVFAGQLADSRELATHCGGYRAMLLGVSPRPALLDHAPQLHRFVLAEEAGEGVGTISEFSSLPLPSEVVDLAIMHHVLDFSPWPHEALKEVSRVVLPSGCILVYGFNPLGWPGLGRLPMRLVSANGLWRSRCLSAWRVSDWLKLLGFQVESVDYGGFKPPLQSRRLLARLGPLERLGRRLGLPLGAYYVIVARKQRLRPINTPAEGLLARAMNPVKLGSARVRQPDSRKLVGS